MVVIYLYILIHCFLGDSVNLIQMPDTNSLKKETSVISSPSHNKHVSKTETTNNRRYIKI